MKNLFKSIMMVAVAAISFTSCSNNFTEEIVTGEKIQFNVSAVNEEVTRSAFGEPSEGKYPTLWSGNEGFALNINGERDMTTSDVEATFSGDKRAVNLSANIEFETAPETYTLYAIAPATAYVSVQPSGWQVTIPTSQTTGTLSCDPAAQILVGASETKASASETFDMTFKHAVAYAKMSLKNLALDGATISSVAITSTVNIANRFYINQATREYSDNSGAKTITVNTTSTENIWFALAPVDVSNTQLKIVVNTDKGTFTKTVTMPANRKFELGKISTFNVDMNGIELAGPVKYELLEDASNLKVGDKVVIAAADYNFAISTTQNGNNRGQAAITKSADKKTISDPGAGVEIFTVEEGTQADTYAFKVTGTAGYIYAASGSSNYMRTQETLDANGSWTVTVDANGLATIKAQGTNTRNWLRYNPSNSIFSCYGSGQKDVVIYHMEGEEQEPDTTPQIIPADATLTIEADVTAATVELTLNNITENVTVDWEADWIEAEVDSNTLYIDASENTSTEQREAVLTLSANGAEATVTLVQKGATQTVTINQVTSAGNYIVTGTVVAVGKQAYIIGDNTGVMMVYHNNSGRTVGENITISGEVTIYTSGTSFGTPQFTQAAAVTVNSTNNTWTYNPTVLDAAGVDAMLNETLAKEVQIAGQYVVSGNYVNIAIDGTTTQGAIKYVDNDLYSSFSGKNVIIKGYFVGASSGKYVNILPYSIEEDGSVTPEPEQPTPGTGGGTDDFATIDVSTSYNTYESTDGWNCVNCCVLRGGNSNSNPNFIMFGEASTHAICMNGKTSAVGTITSPILKDGCGTLEFNYGIPYGDNKIEFKVEIKQNGVVVKTFTVDEASATKFTVYSHNETVNVAGDFQIVFTNLSPSNSTSNKDRTAIWNVVWTGYEN